MAALVVVNLRRLKLTITAIKKDDLTKLTTITLAKSIRRKTIAICLLKIFEKGIMNKLHPSGLRPRFQVRCYEKDTYNRFIWIFRIKIIDQAVYEL